VIGAEHGVGERGQREDSEPCNQKRTRGVLAGGERGQRRERDCEVIGIALLEAERTGLKAEHQLEIPGARDRRRRDDQNRQCCRHCG
jgi:hypothetical protein